MNKMVIKDGKWLLQVQIDSASTKTIVLQTGSQSDVDEHSSKASEKDSTESIFEA